MEKMRTIFLMGGLVLLFMYVGNLVAGEQGMMMALLLACGINFFSYFFSDKVVLSQYRAKEVTQASAPQLYEIVKRLSRQAQLPMPRVYIIPEAAPNAFATGRNPQHAAVAATQGLLDLMSAEEIEGVLAHEMSHVKHYDILIGTVAAVFAGAIGMLANFAKTGSTAQNRRGNGAALLVGSLLMPLAATIIQMAISRRREYRADEGAAYLTRHPEWLMSALSKLEGYSKNYQMKKVAPQTAHLFIVDPISGALAGLFKTHPSTADRIKRLQEIKQQL